MAPRTVQQAFGLKDPELNALAVLAGLEGYRGDGGRDVAAVASNVLSRRLAGNWGGFDVRNIAKSPGQYEAVFDYSMSQLADPEFGARVLGGPQEFQRVKSIVNNLGLVGEQFEKSRGAQSFRGVAAYGAKKPTDYVPVPGKSNFYFDPLSESLYKKGKQLFISTDAPSVQQASKTQKAQRKTTDENELLKAMLFDQMLKQSQTSQGPLQTLYKGLSQPGNLFQGLLNQFQAPFGLFR